MKAGSKSWYDWSSNDCHTVLMSEHTKGVPEAGFVRHCCRVEGEFTMCYYMFHSLFLLQLQPSTHTHTVLRVNMKLRKHVLIVAKFHVSYEEQISLFCTFAYAATCLPLVSTKLLVYCDFCMCIL